MLMMKIYFIEIVHIFENYYTKAETIFKNQN